MNYGEPPTIIGVHHVKDPEMMLYQYLPIKMADGTAIVREDRLKCFDGLIGAVACDYVGVFGLDRFVASYMYLTARHQYQGPHRPQNRPGWHTDGFGSQDVNYIWSDISPTEFSAGPFRDISTDHRVSMEQFQQQAQEPYCHEPGTLLRLTPFVVHRVAKPTQEGMRTFLKLSFSSNKYALRGNSINHMIDYRWDMAPRDKERNDPIATK